jgi:hypothetical protein
MHSLAPQNVEALSFSSDYLHPTQSLGSASQKQWQYSPLVGRMGCFAP